jgi:hypothetical protein
MSGTKKGFRATRRHAQLLGRRLFRRTFTRRLYRDPGGGVERSVLVAGTGRSGTTWLADLVDSALPTRLMFEPFHCRRVEEFERFPFVPYMRANVRNEALRSYCVHVFTGEIRQPWIDRTVSHLRPRIRLIKAIRANLILKWIREEFPRLPIVFIVRHPCAVVASRMKLGWATDSDFESFLSQTDLVSDFLGKYLHIVREAREPEERHAVVWCVHNMVPFEQLEERDACFVSYERLLSSPEEEISRIFSYLALEAPTSSVNFGRPSTTSQGWSATVRGENALRSWQRHLDAQQVHRIWNVLEAFGMSGLYEDPLGPTFRD